MNNTNNNSEEKLINDENFDVAVNHGLSSNNYTHKEEEVPKYSLDNNPILEDDVLIEENSNLEKEEELKKKKKPLNNSKDFSGNLDLEKETDGQKPSKFSFFKKKKKSGLDLLETDLIKDEVAIKFEWRRDLIGAIVLFIIALFIILETYLFLSWWSQKREVENFHYLEQEINYIKEEIDKIENDYLVVNEFKDNLILANNILRGHIYWTNFFEYLEKNTLKRVYYTSFFGNLSNQYLLPAVTNDVRAISYQTKALLSDERTLDSSVSDEEIIDSEEDNTKVNFNLNFQLNPNILNK